MVERAAVKGADGAPAGRTQPHPDVWLLRISLLDYPLTHRTRVLAVSCNSALRS